MYEKTNFEKKLFLIFCKTKICLKIEIFLTYFLYFYKSFKINF